MKRYILISLCVALLVMVFCQAIAEEQVPQSSFDSIVNAIDDCSLEELQSIDELLDEKIQELKRQYAIENGNRIISFENNEVTLFVQKTNRAIPTVTRVVDDAPKTTFFKWTSSDTNVARVSGDGTVTGVNCGDAVITCTANDDQYIFGSYTVHIVAPVKTLTLDNSTVQLLLGSDSAKAGCTLKCTIAPQDAYYQTVTWTSSNESVATVDANGHVTAKSAGTATITVTSDEPVSGGMMPKKASCKVTVSQAVRSLALNSAAEITLNKYSSTTLTATVGPNDATNKKVEWTSTNTNVATVSSYGQVSAKGCGSCVIKCTAADGSGVSASVKVTVIQMVSSLRINTTAQQTICVGNLYFADTTITPADATTKTLNWTTSNARVATVNNGRITAVGPGNCIITCATTDGSNKSATLKVFVPSIAVSSTYYNVTSKKGMSIPVTLYGSGRLKISCSSNYYFNATLSGSTINIEPLVAGSATITLTDSSISEYANTVKITVNISHDAVYDNISYPKASYDSILRYPSSYKGDNMFVYGRVLQKMVSGSSVTLRVGTSGYGYSDVFYITYSSNDIKTAIIEDDYIYVYGKCKGAKTYTTVLGGEITIPWIEAEKVVLSRNY